METTCKAQLTKIIMLMLCVSHVGAWVNYKRRVLSIFTTSTTDNLSPLPVFPVSRVTMDAARNNHFPSHL